MHSHDNKPSSTSLSSPLLQAVFGRQLVAWHSSHSALRIYPAGGTSGRLQPADRLQTCLCVHSRESYIFYGLCHCFCLCMWLTPMFQVHAVCAQSWGLHFTKYGLCTKQCKIYNFILKKRENAVILAGISNSKVVILSWGQVRTAGRRWSKLRNVLVSWWWSRLRTFLNLDHHLPQSCLLYLPVYRMCWTVLLRCSRNRGHLEG